jgi:hypothetical protein
MYRFKICNQIKLVCFLKFIIHKINSEIVKPGIVVLTGREKADADVAVARCCSLLLKPWWAREGES